MRAFERKAVGDVLRDEEETAERMRRHDLAQRRAVGQMKQFLHRLGHRREEALQALLVGAPVRLLG